MLNTEKKNKGKENNQFKHTLPSLSHTLQREKAYFVLFYFIHITKFEFQTNVFKEKLLYNLMPLYNYGLDQYHVIHNQDFQIIRKKIGVLIILKKMVC